MSAADQEVVVFCLPDPEHCAGAVSWLEDSEKERADRLRRIEDRALFIGAHALLHFSLWRQGGRRDLAIVTDPCGKPRLSDNSLQFSLSHSSGMALCAVSRGAALGVDVERIDPQAATAALAAEVFCPAEQDWIGKSAERFFALWTVKEALFKAAGEVWSDQWRYRSVLSALSGSGWQGHWVERRRLGGLHLAALAVASPVAPPVAWRMVTPDEIA